MGVRFWSLRVLLCLLITFTLASCTPGVVPSYALYNWSNNAWPFVDGGVLDGSPPYFQNDSKTPAVENLNNQLYLVSVGGSPGGINTYLYNGQNYQPYWNYYGYFSPQSTPGNAATPSLSVFGSSLYAAWTESNTGTDSGINQIHAAFLNGNAWTSIDGAVICGGTHCLNTSHLDNAVSPVMSTSNSNSTLNLLWCEIVGGAYQVVGLYTTNLGTNPTWNSIPTLNRNTGDSAFNPKDVPFGTKFYVAWAENSAANSPPAQIHVDSTSDDITFTNVDGGLPTMSETGVAGAATPFLAVNNGKIYVAWVGSYAGSVNRVRVAVYNGNDGSPSWAPVDNGIGLNFNSSLGAITPMMVTATNNQLYISWTESNSQLVTQVRVAVYNGNDGSPAWTFVDGGGLNGLNFNSSINSFAPSLTNFNGNLYSAWEEFNSGGTDLSRVRFLF